MPDGTGDQAASKAGQEKKPEIKEETIDSLIPTVEKKVDDTVPLSKYMEEKNERRRLEIELAKASTQNENKPLSTKDLRELAKKHNADPELLESLAEMFDEKYSKSAPVTNDDPALREKLDAIERGQKQQEFDKKFDEFFAKSLTNSPEFKDIANKEVIKSLVMQPENKNLTISQLLDKTYGNAVNRGTKTIESAQAATKDKTADDVDFAKMDDSDWESVKNNPDLKAKYNEYIVKNIQL